METVASPSLWGLVPLLLYIALCFSRFGQIFAVLVRWLDRKSVV